jgi:hypothetical protein
MKSTANIPPSTMPGLPFPYQVNTRLIAAVQNHAGAHCHTSANLLQCYYFCAEVYRVQLRNNDPTAAEAARRGVQRAEVRLREFLTDLMWNRHSSDDQDGGAQRHFNAVCC